MLSCLDRVRMGLMRPQTFQNAEMTRRSLNFDLSSAAVVEPVFTAAISSLSIDSTGRYLLSGASDGSWYIHDTFNLRGGVDHKKGIVTSCGRGTVHKRSISTVEWYPEDSGLFVTSSNEGLLCIWDANEPSRPADKFNFPKAITRHQINPSVGSTIAVCTGGKVKLIDVRAGSSIQTLPETLTKSIELRWNPRNQNQLIVGSDEGHLIEWDVRSTLSYRGYGLLEVRVARRAVRTRDFKEQVNLLQKAHLGGILSLRYRRDGMEFYSLGEDGRIRRWMSDTNPISEPCISTCTFGRGFRGRGRSIGMDIAGDIDPPLAFAPHGTCIKMCDLKECRVRKELRGHFKEVNCFVYDGIWGCGYSGGNDASVMVWSGHSVQEQTWLEEKGVKARSEGGRGRSRAGNSSGGLINLFDEEEEYDEYEVVSSSSDDNELFGRS